MMSEGADPLVVVDDDGDARSALSRRPTSAAATL